MFLFILLLSAYANSLYPPLADMFMANIAMLDKIKTSVLILHGEEDKIVPPQVDR